MYIYIYNASLGPVRTESVAAGPKPNSGASAKRSDSACGQSPN